VAAGAVLSPRRSSTRALQPRGARVPQTWLPRLDREGARPRLPSGAGRLYHYFDSKADLATWLVRQPHLDWQLVYIDPAVDAVRQLGACVDLAIAELPDFLLALDLAEELEVPGVARKRRALFREGENVLGRYLAAVRPGLTPEAARDLAALILSLLVGSHEIAGDQGSDPAAVRDRVVRVLRAELVPVAVDSARFDREIAAH
jgi:AcrR family transcriptional regulator